MIVIILWKGYYWLRSWNDLQGNSIKGEFTVVLDSQELLIQDSSTNLNDEVGVKRYLESLRADGISRSEAVKIVTEICSNNSKSKNGLKKSNIYKIALDMREW